MNPQERIQKLESLLSRVQQRARSAGAAEPVTAPPPVVATHVTASATSRPFGVDDAPPTAAGSTPARSWPPPASTPPEAGWSSHPPPNSLSAPPVPVLDVVPDPFPASSAPPPMPALPLPSPSAPVVTAAPLELVDDPPLEALDEDDLMEEIPADMLESIPPYEVAPVVPSYSDDEPPASSQRARVVSDFSSSLDASDEPLLDEGREVPLKTPPPESGQQAAAPAVVNYATTDDTSEVDQLLEADLPLSAGTSVSPSPFDTVEAPFRSLSAPAGPTPEQLGQTIDLEEAAGPALELDAPTRPTTQPPSAEELEAPLPAPAAGGRYDDSLLPPPGAEHELAAHLDRTAEAALDPVTEVRPSLVDLGAPGPVTLPASAARVAEAASSLSLTVDRPALTDVPHEFKPNLDVPDRPRSFLELLDASIRLGS